MDKWKPDFHRLRVAVTRESLPDRIPTAEVGIDLEIMDEFLGQPITDIKTYASFWVKANYDYMLLQVRGQPLFDASQVKIAEGVLTTYLPKTSSTMQGRVTDEKSFDEYPWIGSNDVYYKDVDIIKDYLPDGMKLIVNHGPLYSAISRTMGLEAMSIAMVDNPDLLRAVANKIGALCVHIVENLVQREWVGGIWWGDDMAYTTGLMVPPDFLRTYVFDFYRQIGSLCRQYGKLFLFHSDGQIEEVFEDLIECGIQATHPNEPTSVNIVELKKRWGDRLSFCGNIDVGLLVQGQPEDITNAVRKLIEQVGPGGGFILSSGNSIAKYIPLANYKAMLNALRTYGDIYS